MDTISVLALVVASVSIVSQALIAVFILREHVLTKRKHDAYLTVVSESVSDRLEKYDEQIKAVEVIGTDILNMKSALTSLQLKAGFSRTFEDQPK